MLLHQTELFHNTSIDTSPIQIKQYPTKYTIELEGTTCTYIAIVLEGTIGITSYNASGTSIHLQTLHEGMMVGDVLLYGTKDHMYPGNLVTVTPATIATIPYELVDQYLHDDAIFRKNLLTLISQKAYTYSLETKLLSQDTLRDKILHYLTLEQQRQGTNKIQLPMTKEELAKKMHVKRPSLSRELSQMKREGLIDYNRWTITIIE
ncbi:Crp/Fnr family transcriptional regulator [Candidatus Xianfuyuplasma coldseepsis]|uniref:Crp/Fnr family transcriptional regulator n=1 Tax=Candidatus Xianfuyuplasma coldseepsis TaxID=2782163 RepID=A0A7L7KR62_9MOLU|nr:Crp/Fnr family transcriptional regulator [Xianfuyuplasma coldseepsis]QMS85177.1 Crp/Fnr family transcriptional regulator [Xianfuyuplasma coldseepsis]